MYRGKRVKHDMSRRKSVALVASLVLLLSVTVGGVVAFLSTSAGPVVNTFLPSKVPPHIVEEFDGETKSNVQIKNDGNVDAYIRAAIVVNWVNGSDVYGEKPGDDDYDMVLNKASDSNGDKWVQSGEYYYWTGKVGPGDDTGILVSECTLADGVTPPDGYSLSLEILAQSIQADGKSGAQKPVEIAWGIDPENLGGG